MGHVLSREGFSRAIKRIGKTRRIYAPQLKRGRVASLTSMSCATTSRMTSMRWS